MAYHHTQFGWVTVLGLGGGLLAIMVVIAMIGFYVLLVPLLLLFLFLAVGLSSLTVWIEGGRLEVRFGPGIIRRGIPLTDIRGVRRVRNRWFYGWGIRYTPHGWLWNVSGLDAVELDLANGRRFRIGTDDPERLEAALRRATSLLP